MSRKILAITGADHVDFLDNLVSNSVAKLTDGPVYAALLTPQGKYLADFILSAANDAILLDVDAALAPALMQRLAMYKLRADVQIAETDLKAIRGQGEPPKGAFLDPRNPALGWVCYGNGESEISETEWTALRVQHMIPESGIELIPNDTYILEAGFERLNGVDFRKGCYVGQEVTARMKHKTELKKGMVRVHLSAEVPVGTEIKANEKSVGTVFSQSNGQGIAYVRFDRTDGAMVADGANVTL